MSAESRGIFQALGLHFGQLGVVVNDLEGTIASHAALGPWMLYTYDVSRVRHMHIGGKPADFSFRLALNPHTPQLEIIAPLDDQNPYAAWLGEYGPGLHHLGFYVDDLPTAEAAMEGEGFAPIMGGAGMGADGTGGWCYYDTVAAVGYIIEVIELPVERRPPEATVALPQ